MAQKLTSAQRKKFESQAAHAKRIMDKAPTNPEGVINNPKTYQLASRARQRALKMLGRGKPFPNETGSGVRPKRKGSSVRARVMGAVGKKMTEKLSPKGTIRKLGGVQERAETGGGTRPKGVDEKTYKKYFGNK